MRNLLALFGIFALAVLSSWRIAAHDAQLEAVAEARRQQSLYHYRVLYPDVQPFLSPAAALAALQENFEALEHAQWAEFEYENTGYADIYGMTKSGGYKVQPLAGTSQYYSAFGYATDVTDPANKQLLQALVNCHLKSLLFYNTANSGIYVFHVSSGLGNSPVVLTHEVPTVPIGQGTDVLFIKSYDPKLDFKALGGLHKGDSWWQLRATTPIEKVLEAVRVQD